MGVGPTGHTTRKIVDYRCGLGGKLSRQCLDSPLRNAAFRGSPLRCLGDAVFCSHDISLHLIKADGMGLDILCIVGAFFYPHVDDGQLQSSISVRQDGNPFIGMDCRTIVQVRTDIYLLYADL